MKPRITIRDVAREAGMSLSTVSGALNGAKGYSEKTVKRIWEVANRLNYTPQASARSLRTGSGEEIRQKTSLLIHIVARASKEPTVNAGDTEAAITCLAVKAQERNFFTIPYTYYQLNGFRCPPLLNGLVDGALIGTPHLEVVRAVSAKVPSVLMDVAFSPGLANIPMVNCDWGFGSAMMIQRLRELGHKKIVILQPYLKNYDKASDAAARDIIWETRKTAEDEGIEIDEKYSFAGDFTPENNTEMIRQFAEHLIPGIRKKEVSFIFAPHVFYLECLLPILQEAGIRSPEDVSMCGPLVSVNGRCKVAAVWLDRQRLFDSALNLLEKLIAGIQPEAMELLLRPQLVEKPTLGPAPKK